jgi:homoserine trans-succinylase
VKTLVKQENNMEIFVTDAPEVDFDKLNEEQSRDLREKFEMVDQQS